MSLLGGHVRRRADDVARLGDLRLVGLQAGQAEVQDACPRRARALRLQPDVGRLDVAMDQTHSWAADKPSATSLPMRITSSIANSVPSLSLSSSGSPFNNGMAIKGTPLSSPT